MHVTANITTINRLSANIRPVDKITAQVYRGIIEGGGLPYAGPYDVTPAFTAQTLQTRNKIMRDDVTVRAINVSRTTNPQGGKTIYIGEVY